MSESGGAEVTAVALLKARRIEGLETLVRQHQARALKLSHAITHDHALSEDVVADSFLHAYDQIGQFDSGRPFGPWFLRMVVHASLKAARRTSVTVSQGARHTEPVAAGADPAQIAELREIAAATMRAMSHLTPKLRAVLVMRYVLDMSQADMAVTLNCPEGTVKSRLHDARAKLRAQMARAEFGLIQFSAKEII